MRLLSGTPASECHPDPAAGLGVGRLSVGGLAVGWLGVRVLGVGVNWVSSRRRGLSRAMALHVANVCGEVVAFQRFLELAAEIHLGAPNWPWVRHLPVRNFSGARLMDMRERWPAQ